MILKSITLLAFAAAAPASCSLSERDDDGALRDISPAAMQALPAGVDPGFLIRDASGCYGISIERTDPPSGIALRDANGTHVCDA